MEETHDIAKSGNSAYVPREYRWPESELYVSEKHRLAYCPIQKVACSSLKLWWAELVDGTSAPFVSLNEHAQRSVDHGALNKRYKLHYAPPSLGRRPVEDDDWFRMVFVRNPWARLVSAFVNKFVTVHDVVAKPVFEEAHQHWRRRRRARVAEVLRQMSGRPAPDEQLRDSSWLWVRGKKAWPDEFTFRHFVELLAACNLDHADLHWRPQYRFLGHISFHLVGRLERLEEDLRTVSNRLGEQIPLPAVNRSNYAAPHPGGQEFADCPLKVLRRLPQPPDFRQFYTRQLRKRVGELYQRDVERFGYDFEGPREVLPEVARKAA